MRYLLPFVLVAAFGLACGTDAQPTVAQTPTTDALKKVPSSTATPTDLASPELAPFRQFVEAVNRADTAAALALLTEDVVWERGGQCPPAACKGKQLAERELTRDVGAHHQLDTASRAARVVSVLATKDGKYFTFVVNAPVFVNSDFLRAFSSGLNGTFLLVKTGDDSGTNPS